MEGNDTIFIKGDLFYRYIRGDESLAPVKRSESQRWKHLPKSISAAYRNYNLQKTFYFSAEYFMKLNRYDKKVCLL